MKRCAEITDETLGRLLAPWGLVPVRVGNAPGDENAPIPGTYWGEPEAGLVDNRVYLRSDTPVHSLLHETCHYICMPPERREGLHTDAGGGYDEENAVCYLQILLADRLEGWSGPECMADMDEWGYTFRLGSTRAWFEEDAEDARDWLIKREILNPRGQPTGRVNGGA